MKRRLSFVLALIMIVTIIPIGTYFVFMKAKAENGGTDISGIASLVGTSDNVRIAGDNRYETSIAVADALKKAKNIDDFENIIIANGVDYPDALSASYLSSLLGAPILLTNTKGKNNIAQYTANNLAKGGTIFVVGGPLSVSDDYYGVLSGIAMGKGGKIERLAGDNRYLTNLAVLERAKQLVTETPTRVFICSGAGYADALSVASIGEPILLVSPKGLKNYQEEYLLKGGFSKAYVVGGPDAVTLNVESAVKKIISNVVRLEGSNRYETSKAVACEFFGPTTTVDTVVLAYANNFPDALSGGLLANVLKAPLVLAADTKKGVKSAIEYSQLLNGQIEYAAALGGDTFITDKLVRDILGDETEEPTTEKETYTVTFKDYDGTVLKTESVEYGFSATPPASPIRLGYKFDGWNKPFNNITSDLIITATYIVNNTPTISLSSITANVGDNNVCINVNVINNPGFLTMALCINYDSSALTLTGVKNGTKYANYNFTVPKNKSSGCKAAWFATDLPEEIVNAEIMTLVFDVAPNAKKGSYPITVSCPTGSTVDGNKTPIAFADGIGYITVN